MRLLIVVALAPACRKAVEFGQHSAVEARLDAATEPPPRSHASSSG